MLYDKSRILVILLHSSALCLMMQIYDLMDNVYVEQPLKEKSAQYSS